MVIRLWEVGDSRQTAEKEGTKSMRQDYEADLTHYDPETGTVDFKGLKHVEMRFSNSCNMACLHCSEVYSSQWGSRLKNYKPDQDDWDHNLEQLLKTQHREGPEDNKQIRLSKADALDLADDLNKNFPNIEKIDFIKIPSGEINNFVLLRKISNLKKKII